MNVRKWGAICVLLIPITGWGQTLKVDPQLAKTVHEIRAENSGAEAMEFMIGVYRTDRWADFAHFQQTARYLEKTMRDIGLSKVESLPAPADGVTQYGFWTMPLAWDVKAARLEVAEPAVPEDVRVLADYHQEPASLVMWSGATPAGGITAEVVELKPPTMEQLKRIDVKNKMVLMDPPPSLSQRGALKAALYKLGAAAMIKIGRAHV